MGYCFEMTSFVGALSVMCSQMHLTANPIKSKFSEWLVAKLLGSLVKSFPTQCLQWSLSGVSIPVVRRWICLTTVSGPPAVVLWLNMCQERNSIMDLYFAGPPTP